MMPVSILDSFSDFYAGVVDDFDDLIEWVCSYPSDLDCLSPELTMHDFRFVFLSACSMLLSSSALSELMPEFLLDPDLPLLDGFLVFMVP